MGVGRELGERKGVHSCERNHSIMYERESLIPKPPPLYVRPGLCYTFRLVRKFRLVWLRGRKHT